MIIFKKLNWSNFFSYGDDNTIDFLESPVTQLVGQNGVGKTSVPLILQEVLYGKNVKKIVKADLPNRNIEKCGISADLHFSVNEVNYVLAMTRKSAKITVELLQDGIDISSHTTPATMKTLENILGMNFETFSQLVYQSSKSSLQFLTATDTQRKKFLITLFNLEKYLEIHEDFKKVLTEAKLELSEANGRCNLYEEWIKDNISTDISKKELNELPEKPEAEQIELNNLEVTKSQIEKTNKDINKNNAYIVQLDSIDKELLTTSLAEPAGISELRTERISINTIISEKEKTIKSLDGKSDHCPVCKQTIDIGDSKELAEKFRQENKDLKIKVDKIIIKLKKLEDEATKDKEIAKAIQQFENLTNLIDEEVPKKTISSIEVQTDINTLQSDIKAKLVNIDKLTKENNVTSIHNSKVDALQEQLVEYKTKLTLEANKLDSLLENVSHVEVLKEAFGTNGLISYKLEYLTKDLEIVINEYLEELSRGRFQLSFILKGDKLNVEVIDQGRIVNINSLSEGELSRVTVSTLLAIRKLMQNLSNTKLNLLFLDEIMGVLDIEGREDLVNVLLAETSLNTYLVSHEYKHPLVPVLEVTQENGVSRVENGI